jgi:hypothetical protein
VHRGDDPPTAEATAILAYRDRDTQRLRLLELTPRAATLCAHLLAGATLQAALVDTCNELGEPMNDEFLAAMALLPRGSGRARRPARRCAPGLMSASMDSKAHAVTRFV